MCLFSQWLGKKRLDRYVYVLLSEIENFQFQPLAIYDTLSIFLTSNIEMQTKIEGHIL